MISVDDAGVRELEVGIDGGLRCLVVTGVRSFVGEVDGGGLRQGVGSSMDGDRVYEGVYVDGVRHGVGVLQAGESRIRGEFDRGKVSGFCIIERSGFEYIGNAVQSKIEGVGIEKSKIGEYLGNFMDGKRSGFGYLRKTAKSGYIGNWVNNTPDGFGEETLKNSDCFVGDFIKGKKSGIGQLTIQSQKVTLIGQFVNGIPNGLGQLNNLKSIYTGGWRQGKKHGVGLLKVSETKFYFGQWVEDRKEGKGYSCDGNTEMKGYFVNGYPQGKAIFKNAGQQPIIVIFNKGKPKATVKDGVAQALSEFDDLDFKKFHEVVIPGIKKMTNYIEINKNMLENSFKNLELNFGPKISNLNKSIAQNRILLGKVFQRVAILRDSIRHKLANADSEDLRQLKNKLQEYLAKTFGDQSYERLLDADVSSTGHTDMARHRVADIIAEVCDAQLAGANKDVDRVAVTESSEVNFTIERKAEGDDSSTLSFKKANKTAAVANPDRDSVRIHVEKTKLSLSAFRQTDSDQERALTHQNSAHQPNELTERLNFDESKIELGTGQRDATDTLDLSEPIVIEHNIVSGSDSMMGESLLRSKIDTEGKSQTSHSPPTKSFTSPDENFSFKRSNTPQVVPTIVTAFDLEYSTANNQVDTARFRQNSNSHASLKHEDDGLNKVVDSSNIDKDRAKDNPTDDVDFIIHDSGIHISEGSNSRYDSAKVVADSFLDKMYQSEISVAGSVKMKDISRRMSSLSVSTIQNQAIGPQIQETCTSRYDIAISPSITPIEHRFERIDTAAMHMTAAAPSIDRPHAHDSQSAYHSAASVADRYIDDLMAAGRCRAWHSGDDRDSERLATGVDGYSKAVVNEIPLARDSRVSSQRSIVRDWLGDMYQTDRSDLSQIETIGRQAPIEPIMINIESTEHYEKLQNHQHISAQESRRMSKESSYSEVNQWLGSKYLSNNESEIEIIHKIDGKDEHEQQIEMKTTQPKKEIKGEKYLASPKSGLTSQSSLVGNWLEDIYKSNTVDHGHATPALSIRRVEPVSSITVDIEAYNRRLSQRSAVNLISRQPSGDSRTADIDMWLCSMYASACRSDKQSPSVEHQSNMDHNGDGSRIEHVTDGGMTDGRRSEVGVWLTDIYAGGLHGDDSGCDVMNKVKSLPGSESGRPRGGNGLLELAHGLELKEENEAEVRGRERGGKLLAGNLMIRGLDK